VTHAAPTLRPLAALAAAALLWGCASSAPEPARIPSASSAPARDSVPDALGKRMQTPATAADGHELALFRPPPGGLRALEGSIRVASPAAPHWKPGKPRFDSASSWVRASGGRSIALRNGRVRLKFPARAFDSLYASLLRLDTTAQGSRRITDLTGAYVEAGLRRQKLGVAISAAAPLSGLPCDSSAATSRNPKLRRDCAEWKATDARLSWMRNRADSAVIFLEVRKPGK
jgi:hypothetical protein